MNGERLVLLRNRARWTFLDTDTGEWIEVKPGTVYTETPITETPCGARAHGGPCVLPRGHNMGRADVPKNHRARMSA